MATLTWVVISDCKSERDFHNTKNLVKHITDMTQNNLYAILGDLKQDVEVDTTGILHLFFPFSILVKSILV